ncbi:MAG: fumarylacetoacetate hydrolase family protein [Nocardioidaceae bacterium]|nr:fumarylacetoacetate hydrolase family protein [Nocardioidaceae bacterium]
MRWFRRSCANFVRRSCIADSTRAAKSAGASPGAAVTGGSTAVGDLIQTGTPVGTALAAPPKPVEIIGHLLPPALKWKLLFDKQRKNPKYLADGDVVELEVRTADGTLDLGRQRTVIRFA